MPLVYRSMKGENGKPKRERNVNALGVRIERETVDMQVEADGSVKATHQSVYGNSVHTLRGCLLRRYRNFFREYVALLKQLHFLNMVGR